MQGNLTVGSFGLLIIAISLGSFGQISMKFGLAGDKIPIVPSMVQTLINVLQMFLRPYVLGGFVLYGISSLFWLLVISRVRLSVAYPMISLSYILVVVLSTVILKEHVDWRLAGIGLLLIIAGVSFIGFGLGQAGGR